MNVYITPTGWILLGIALSLVSILIVVILVYQFKKPPQEVLPPPVSTQTKQSEHWVITSQDIKAIAGDDVMVTKLDLARAYIELGKKKLAHQILSHVQQHGNDVQQQAAKQLISTL